jgi:hypothetical protein
VGRTFVRGTVVAGVVVAVGFVAAVVAGGLGRSSWSVVVDGRRGRSSRAIVAGDRRGRRGLTSNGRLTVH